MSRVPRLVVRRRSTRRWRPDPVPGEVLDDLVVAAALAPAPHHSRPWRWVVVESAPARRALAEAMGAAWARDLVADGVDAERVRVLLTRSRDRIEAAPGLLLGCVCPEGLDRYPDRRRRESESAMALLSLGAAVENLMLAAAARGLGTCWVAAPVFCPDAARQALDLPAGWTPAALVEVGRPAVPPRPRLPVSVDALRLRR